MVKRFVDFKAFKELVVDENGDQFEDVHDLLHHHYDDVFLKTDAGNLPLEFIEQEGGGEGGGEACYTVLKAGDQYYRIDYSYYSYNGYETDYAEVYLVTPVERMVTFYE